MNAAKQGMNMTGGTRIVLGAVLVVVLGLLTSIGAARAEGDGFDRLREDARIHNGLLAVVIGRHIELTCPEIERRQINVTTFLLGLATHAMSLGYSRAEVEAYVDSNSEQDRFFGLARQWFAARGVTSDEDVPGACRVGRDEIAAGSAIGRLLREG